MGSIKDSLRMAGMKDNQVDILSFFLERKQSTSRQIERELMLRQPEVSLVTSDFVQRGWIASEEIYRNVRGRPEKLYNLVMTREQILNGLADELAGHIGQMKDAEEALRSAI